MAQSEFVKKHGPDNHVYYGTAAPTAGTYERGDLLWNTSPSSGSPHGWACVTGGSPGTWRPFGNLNANDTYWGTAAPVAGTYKRGDVVWNSSAAAEGVSGWICTVAGTPGTWAVISYAQAEGINELSVSALTSAGTITTGKGLVTVSLAAGNTMTLAPSASHPVGFRQSIKNLANNSVTIATIAGATYADAAAITLAQYASVTIVGNGSTWFKVD